MQRIVTYKPITPKGEKLGWEQIKIVHVIDNDFEYKEFYYISNKFLYNEHKYKTVWIKFLTFEEMKRKNNL